MRFGEDWREQQHVRVDLVELRYELAPQFFVSDRIVAHPEEKPGAVVVLREDVERIRITSGDGCDTIVDLRDPDGKLPNVFRLSAGENTIAVPGRESVPFPLAHGRIYALTLCGDNGWGRAGCRTERLELPRG
ncbi:MAG: hypothetical protein ACYC7A_06740 [Thermoanaerobaculia bacterium]